MKILFSLSSGQTEKNSWKKLGKTKFVFWWFDVINKKKEFCTTLCFAFTLGLVLVTVGRSVVHLHRYIYIGLEIKTRNSFRFEAQIREQMLVPDIL